MGEKETPPTTGTTGGQTGSTGSQTGSTGGQTGSTGGQTGSTGGQTGSGNGGQTGSGNGGPTNGGMTGSQDPHPQLSWDDARKEMFKDMTHDEQNKFWMSESDQQDKMVQDWHQEHFGLPTSTARGQH
jgi:hypothetical protein